MKTAFVIRHSKRNQIENPLKHAEMLLNEEGKKIASNFGTLLADKFDQIKIFSSPIGRCIQTGDCIKAAFKNSSETEIEISNILGEPGPFVFGDAMESFVKLRTTGVVEAIENGKNMPFIRTEEEGTKILLDFVRKETLRCNDNTAVVFVTHDACIAPVINFFTSEYFKDDHWIEFLGGLKIQFDADSITIQRLKGVE